MSETKTQDCNLSIFSNALILAYVQLTLFLLVCVSATSLYGYIDPLIMCRVSIFRLPDIVFGVVSDYVIFLLVAIK